jgi:CRISPR-associated protein Csa2
MFLSVSVRLLANIEALNMVESVGNVARHRRAPIIAPMENGYVLTYVPVVSGECLGHSYQYWLAKIAEQRGIPVCANCMQSFFVKHSDINIFGSLPWEQDLLNKIKSEKIQPAEIEKIIVKNCVVEDIGGFLLPEEIPAKRTSKFQVSFMVPAYEQLKAVAAEAQFHVRYAPEPKLHRIFYTESGSALYTFRFDLDVNEIGCITGQKRESVLTPDERRQRIALAIDAIAHMLENRIFGARLSRYTPISEIRSLLVLVSRPLPFTASAGHEPSFIDDSEKRADAFLTLFNEEKIDGWFVAKEEVKEGQEKRKEGSTERMNISKVNTVSEAFKMARDLILNEFKS